MDDSAQITRLKARAEREKQARKEAEALLEQKSLALFEANQELKVQADRLESIVAQRTEALQVATEDALRLATAKSQFLANISHEFKTPLNGILGSLALLKNTVLDDNQRYMLDTAESSGEALVRLINDVLDVNNLTSKQMNLLNVPFSVSNTLHRALSHFSEEIRKKGLHLTVDISEQLPAWLKGDPTRIRQIFEHLISNAVKFSGSGTLAIKLTYQDTGLKFVITDEGIGIAEQHKEHIFDILTKEDESFSRSYGGIGLGLTLCQKLVTLMGGTIHLTSILHQGTEVGVRLPLAIETENIPDQTDIPADEAPLTPLPDTLSFKGQKVLLVEDNAINQQVAKELLESKSLSVTIVENGLEALNALTSGTYELILMDIQMPVMDGLEATRRIRATSEEYASIPILVLTAHGLPEDVKKSMEAGANEHITKPFNTVKLLTLLTKYLNWQAGSATDIEQQQCTIKKELYGIDLPSALDRLMNNPQLLEKVMIMFYQQYRSFEVKLRQSITELNHEETQRALHTLKGSAGNVSAYALADLAAELERHLKHTQLCSDWFGRYQTELSNIFQELHKVLAGIKAKYIRQKEPSSSATQSEVPLNKTAINSAITKIKANIYVDLTEVEQQIEQLKAHCQASNVMAMADELENAYQTFDYEIMEQRCEDLLRSLADKPEEN